jgi:hypothetical protein
MILIYLKSLTLTVLFLLATVAALNFFVDPAGIYRDGRLNPQSYADALIKSEHGLWSQDDSIDERLLAKAMSSYSQRVECVLIGSSHVMQISSERTPRSLSDVCGSILNLGVSGGSIEDHFILTYLAIQTGRPKKIILGIAPWTFAFGMDQRWSIYKDAYFQAESEILGKKFPTVSNSFDRADESKLVNLINMEYTIRSLQTAARDYIRGRPTIAAAPKLEPTAGGLYPARLRDGSFIYSAKYISDARRATVRLGGETYKTDGKLNQLDAINAYRDLILYIKSKDVEPILLMTPYHENVLKAPKAPNTVAILATEPLIINLAHELDLKVIGSYDPKMFNCLNNEFYDFMHPTAECLMKLRIRSSLSRASEN